MGQQQSDSPAASSVSVSPSDPSAYKSMMLPRDLIHSLLRRPEFSLRDHFALLQVCRMWYHICNTREVWMIRLARHCDEEFPGRTQWRGYQGVFCCLNELLLLLFFCLLFVV